MNRKVIILVAVAVVAVAGGVGGYVLLSGGLLGGGPELITLDSVTVAGELPSGEGLLNVTWQVTNPRDETVGVRSIGARVRGYIDGVGQFDARRSTDESLKLVCTDIGPRETVLVSMNYQGGTFGSKTQAELNAITEWRSIGGLATFISGGCQYDLPGAERLCTEVAGFTTNSCGELPHLSPGLIEERNTAYQARHY